MHILLVNPNREQMPWPVMPVGLCVVASSLHAAGHVVRVLDLTFSSDPQRELREVLGRFTPQLIGVTIRNLDNCNFEVPHFYLPELRDTVMVQLREAAPQAKVVLGGAAVNIAPFGILDYLGADYALWGEGDAVFVDLAEALERGEAVDHLPGLLSRELGPSRQPSAVAVRHAGFCRAPFHQAYRWLDIRRYQRAGGSYPIQTRRGCPFRCSYCAYHLVEGHGVRLRRPSDVVDEILDAYQHGVRRVEFVDSTFNVPVEPTCELLEELLRRGPPVTLTTMGLNPLGVTEKLARLMKRAGFSSAMCAPESASDPVLCSLDKGFDAGDVRRASEVLARVDLPTQWFFLVGAPGETMTTLRETLRFCQRFLPAGHMALFSTGIRVYPGTPLAKLCQDSGWFEKDDPLLVPSFYVSPDLDLAEAYRLLVESAEANPQLMLNAETVATPLMQKILHYGLGWWGLRGAFWTHLPLLFGFFGALGIRRRGLRPYLQAMTSDPELAHRGWDRAQGLG